MSEERPDPRSELRLRQIRQALTVELDGNRVANLAAGLGGRQRARTRRRVLAIGGGATLALALVALLGDRARPPARLTDGVSPVAPVSPVARPENFLDEDRATAAAPIEPAGATGAPSGGLPDQVADRSQAGDRWARYLRSPDTHPFLPNVSYAGYRYGQREGSRASGRVVNVKQPPFGAVGDGISDDTAALRRAIDSVESEGGTVFLPDGNYKVSDVLFVHGSGTVLRGESRARTRLLFTRPLDQTMGPSMAGPFSRWEWAGGLLWFSPRHRQSYPGDDARAASRPEIWPGASPEWARQGWTLGAPLARVIEPAARGDRALVLADGSKLRGGDLVFLVVPASETLLAGGWRQETERGLLADPDRSGPAVVRWPVEITRIDGNVAALAQPLRFDVATSSAAEEGRGPFLQAVPAEDLIRDVGVEQMTLVMQRRSDWRSLGVAEPFGWNGPFFLNALHGFVRQVTVVNGDLGMGTAASKNISLEEIELRSEGLPPDLSPHRAAAIRAQSHDVLVDQLQMDARWLGFRFEGSGFVLSRGRGRFEHMTGKAVDTVLTELTEIGAGPPAATGSLISSGERIVGWNLQPRDATPPAPSAAVPRNLYQAQKQLRLQRSRAASHGR